MTDLIAGPIAAWMAAVIELMSKWPVVGGVGGVFFLGPRFRVTFGLRLMDACGTMGFFFGSGKGEGSVLGLLGPAMAGLRPRRVAEGESSIIASIFVAPDLGVEPKIVRFLPVVEVEQLVSVVSWGFFLRPREAAASKKYFMFLLRTAAAISASWSAAHLSISSAFQMRHFSSTSTAAALVAFLLKVSTRLLYHSLYSSWSGVRCV